MVNVKTPHMVLSNNPLTVQVARHDQWVTNGPKIGADVLPPTPARILITGPSGSGKTQLAVDMLTRLYAGSWERIYVFSPSVHLDSVWNVVKHHVHKTMGVPEEEKQKLTRGILRHWTISSKPSEQLSSTKKGEIFQAHIRNRDLC